MGTAIYSIETVTNLHAGSGDSSYEIVDKEIQRDAATRNPVIYSSSLKGAIREFLEKKIKWEKEKVEAVFGNSETEGKIQQQGRYIFVQADLAALPAPVKETPYYKRVHCCTVLNNLSSSKYDHLGWTIPAAYSFGGSFNEPGLFTEMVNDLPVIARNNLENGISQNLWYERVVPHHSVFLTAVLYPDGDPDFEAFNKHLTGSLVQVGGNATIGYGLCKFTELTKKS